MLEVKPLKYELGAFQPILSSEALFFHYHKHYAGYVIKANELIPIEWRDKPMEEVIEWARNPKYQSVFNQVAQVWNHEFFFSGLSLQLEDKKRSSTLNELIMRDFGGVDELENKLAQAATTRFGSGWVWLILEDNQLKVITTSNAETPIGTGVIKPLWTLDVWEHAYYLDYQNRRLDYAKEIISKLINWRFVDSNLGL